MKLRCLPGAWWCPPMCLDVDHVCVFSANCRLELNYAQQIEDVDMIPLMMQQDYKPQGWCKLQYYHQDLRLF